MKRCNIYCHTRQIAAEYQNITAIQDVAKFFKKEKYYMKVGMKVEECIVLAENMDGFDEVEYYFYKYAENNNNKLKFLSNNFLLLFKEELDK